MAPMKNYIFILLALIIMGEVGYLLVQNNQKHKEEVLAEAVTVTPYPTPEITPSPSPSPTPEITPTPKPTITPVPQPTYSSEQINEFITRFSAQYSVSPDILRYIALCESGFNPSALKLSYAGLYQFGPVTWKNVRSKMGEDTDINLRFNVEEAVQTAAYNLHINNAGIWPNCVP
jgi:hypothetical protein